MSKDVQTADVVVLGTGITESIVAAALSKAGWKVAHIDTNPFYGGNEASLDVREISEWLQQREMYRTERVAAGSSCTGASYSTGEFKRAKAYSVSLTPSVIPATGPFISTLISSGVARYGGFKLLDKVLIYSSASDSLKPIPGSKEDIFKSDKLSLIDKRKLMRFLVFASGDFESSAHLDGKEEMPFSQFLTEVFQLDDRLAVQLSCALAFSFSKDESTRASLGRIRQYVRSTGRYGNSPFLIGHYGGLGEILQGFCRTCAVSGGTYVLARPIRSVEADPSSNPPFRLHLEDLQDPISAHILIMSPEYLSLLPPDSSHISNTDTCLTETTYAMGVVIVNISKEKTTEPTEADKSKYLDGSVLFYLPGEDPEGQASETVCVLSNGVNTNSCPDGHAILYFSTLIKDVPCGGDDSNSFSRQLLQPYVNTTLRLLSDASDLETTFSAFYIRSCTPVSQQLKESLRTQRVLVTQTLDPHLATVSDAAAVEAESIFWEAVKLLKDPEDDVPTTMWLALPDDDDDDDDD